MDPSFQNALVEVNLSTDGRNNVWLDAYFLDVQPSCLKDETEVTDNQGDGDENSGNNQSLMATIVMAVKDEPASFTITQQKHCHQLPMSQIRLKPKLTEPVSFNENNIIEVITVDGNEKFIAWKMAKIKKFKDTNAVIEYLDNNGQIIESKSVEELNVISREDSRTPNPFKPLNDVTVASNPFARAELPVPFFLQYDDSTWLCNIDFHERFKKNVENLINIRYDGEKKSLICIGYTPDLTEYSKKKFINQCHLLSDFHFRALKETYSLSKHMLPPITSQNPNESVLRLSVAKSLIGLSIGKQGANIRKARELDGIHSVELWDEMNTFIIKGNNMEVCQQAANLLNFVQECIEIDNEHSDFFDDELIVQELLDKTGVIKFDLVSENQSNNGSNRTFNNNNLLILRILGNCESVDNFKILFNYQFAEYGEMKKLREQFKDLVGGTVRSSYNQRRRPGGRKFSDVLKNRN
ncbi:RNA-binding protein FXR1 isoform X2 [Dermatophagoides farinae]|uniref:RNA-binding protein FXR1 isoform X2 n=1 Tax=Dermatophagoides farinae TaxID=6954 RepID=UPI003F5E3934